MPPFRPKSVSLFWPPSIGVHPNIDEAVAAFREYLPSAHRIIYQVPAEMVEAA